MKSLVCGETGVGCRCGFETRQFCYQESWLDYGQITTIKKAAKLFFLLYFLIPIGGSDEGLTLQTI